MAQHIEAVHQAPFLVSKPQGDIELVRKGLTEYHNKLIDRVLALPPEVGEIYRPDLTLIQEDQMSCTWKEKLVVDQPVRCLTDLLTLIENFTKLPANLR